VTVAHADVRVTGLPVRALTQTDLPAIVALTADRGWPAEHSKWRLMFAVSEPYGVDDPAGGLAGIVVLTGYGRGLAAVGMMVVASRHGRRGLGRRLMQHVLMLASGAVVFLTATDEGRTLYEQLGFRVVDTSVTYTGQLAPGLAGLPATRARSVVAADVAAICAADLPVFGADRSRVIAELLTFADEFHVLGSPAAGYGAAWAKDGVRVIGPVVAQSLALAAALIPGLVSGWSGTVRIDILGRPADLARWAVSRGLAAGNETALMVRGRSLPGDRARLFCPVTVAIG
jgi:GNAT superfamily N-acetyltransferase